MRHSGRHIALALVMLSANCTVGPRYHRPDVDAPTAYRSEVDTGRAASLGEAKWSTIFRDNQLQRLIGRALNENYDVGIAAARVVQARAQLGITRADQFPEVNAEVTASRQKTPAEIIGNFSVRSVTISTFRIDAQLAWELDFWGKFRSATARERAGLLGTEWAARAVLVSVVGEVAQEYFTLRELDLALDIARRTLTARQESLELTRVQERGGVASMLAVRQAEQLVYTAASVITDTERLITQQENALSVLLGQNPGPIPRGLPLVDQPEPPEVPAGLPSALLERRPDIRQAEQALIAANANIGVAKAQLFPSIALTAPGGVQSNVLSQLFSAPATLYGVAAGLVQPIFNAGRLKSNVRLTEAQKLELVYTYQQTVQRAFREVSDALIAYEKNRVLRAQLADLVASTGDAARLSDVRYRGGVASYLEVLTSQTSFFNAELELARARLNELLALVQLYTALGGGWEQ